MRRLLRSIKTGQYFCRGEWTTDAHSAQDFPDTLNAIETALQAQLLEIEMVLQIGPEPSAAYDICLPLQMLATDLLPVSRTENSPETLLKAATGTAPSVPAATQDPPAQQPDPPSSGADLEPPMANS
ncbi:MAG TPA: hypothetical protein VNZ22_02560 [Bacillota bacterium]|nr:hypothetical protein [Bacillota bacterium]